MKLEFIDQIDDQGKYKGVATKNLIRLYDFSSAEAVKLKQAIQKHLIDEEKALMLGELEFIEEQNCNLVMDISDENQCIRKNDQGFICLLKRKTY